MKTPPQQMSDLVAQELTEDFINKGRAEMNNVSGDIFGKEYTDEFSKPETCLGLI